MNEFKINKDYENIIKKYFKDLSIEKIQARSPKFLNNFPEIKQYLNEYLINFPNWETIKHIIYKIVLNINLPKCLGCGKELSFSQRKRKFCCKKCCNSSDFFLKKKEEIVYKKYGVRSILQAKEIREKINLTIQKDLNFWKNIHQKRNETKIQKYGSLENAEKIRQEKNKETCLKKYGVEHSFQRKDVKEKIKKTLLKKYGTMENYYKCIFEKRKENKIKKYGYYFNDGIEKHWNKIITKWKDYIIPMFSHDEFIGGKKKIYKWKCVKCGNEFEQKIYITGHLNNIDNQLPRCLKCYPKYSGFSLKEKELLEFCKQFFPNLLENDRNLIYPYEIDILIPELKLGIEFNGNWYHSKKAGLKQGYHLEKTLKCNKKGYRLIHIWEDEWDKNKNEIKEKLIDIFKNKQKLNFNEKELKLDRSWFNNIEFLNYILINELKPEIIQRKEYEVENCGYLIYKRKQ